MSVAVILGSAFSAPVVAGETLVAERVDTAFGAVGFPARTRADLKRI